MVDKGAKPPSWTSLRASLEKINFRKMYSVHACVSMRVCVGGCIVNK